MPQQTKSPIKSGNKLISGGLQTKRKERENADNQREHVETRYECHQK